MLRAKRSFPAYPLLIPLHHPLELIAELMHHIFRGEDADVGAEGEDLAEELVAQGDVHDGFGPARALARLDGDVAAEAVEHDAHILIGQCDADGCLLPSEHGKVHLYTTFQAPEFHIVYTYLTRLRFNLH